MNHARLHAKNLRIGSLPLLVAPHPMNDLMPDQVRDLARAAYPIIVEQLTGQGTPAQNGFIDFAHPAARNGQQRPETMSSKGTR